MTKSNDWERVFRAWVRFMGLDPTELNEDSVTMVAFASAWRYSRMTWRDTRAELGA